MTLHLDLPTTDRRDARPPLPPLFLDATAVAKLLDMTRPAFLRARVRLEEQEGFPPPAPQSLRNMKWRRDAVLSWIQLTCPTSAETPSQIHRGALRLVQGSR